jgi:hypothetical protein
MRRAGLQRPAEPQRACRVAGADDGRPAEAGFGSRRCRRGVLSRGRGRLGRGRSGGSRPGRGRPGCGQSRSGWWGCCVTGQGGRRGRPRQVVRVGRMGYVRVCRPPGHTVSSRRHSGRRTCGRRGVPAKGRDRLTGIGRGPSRRQDALIRSKGRLTGSRRRLTRSRRRPAGRRCYPGGGGGLVGGRDGLPGSQTGLTSVRRRFFCGMPRMAGSRRTTGWVLRGPA